MIVPYYADESVSLYLGDCREVTAWLEADVLVTDPPYGIGWRIGVNHAAKSKAHAGIANDADTSCRDRALTMWGDRPAVVFGTWAAPLTGARQTLVWRKPVDAGVVGSTTGYRRDTELIFLTGRWPMTTSRWSSVIATGGGKGRYLNGHPHAKPDHLMQTLIERAPAGVIADPFAGSGSTLVAAKALGRKAIGVELDERYCEIAAARLSQGVLDFGGARMTDDLEPTEPADVDDLRQRVVATLDQHAALVFASGRVECVCGWRMKHSVPARLWQNAIGALRLLGSEVRRLRAELEER